MVEEAGSTDSRPARSAEAAARLGPRARATRERLLRSTEALLGERSALDLSVAEIARTAETSPATFYHYFEDVEAAVLMLAEQVSGELPEALARIEAANTEEATLEWARALVHAFIDHWDRHHAVLLMRNLAADKGDERFQRARRAALSPVLNRLAERIEAARGAGRVDPAIHAHLAAAGLVAVLERLSAHYRDLQTFEASREALVETCSRMIQQTLGGGG